MLYGGQSEVKSGENTMLGDVHIYDVGSEQWSSPVGSDGTPRCWHTATHIQGTCQTLVYGGKGAGNECEITDAMLFDSEIHLWYPLVRMQ